MVKGKKETIIKMVIKIKTNFKEIKNLNKTMMMIGTKWKREIENVNLESRKIKTAMKNKIISRITEAEEEEVSIEEDKEVEETEEAEVEIKKVTQSNDPTKIDLMQ